MTYEIPEEINSEIKIYKSIYLFDLFIVVSALLFAYFTSSIIFPPLVMLYYIFVGGTTLFLLSKNSNNPGRRTFLSIYLLLKKDRNTYYPILKDHYDFVMLDTEQGRVEKFVLQK
nr:DUF5592 family protein [Clostridioides sp.]